MRRLLELLRDWLTAKLGPPHVHHWRVDRVCYVPPIKNQGTDLYWLEPGTPRERAIHGCTTICDACDCGARRETIVLGKAIDYQPAQLFRAHQN